ncbi:MAG: hypothetical protein HC860_05870 [Alkalinema sp. RU_4_3]|nr:hypothetical protein [Alkalinema sp. RU_4_3]
MAKRNKKKLNAQLNDNPQILYQAYGVLRGRLIWTEDNLAGLILTDDTTITISGCKAELMPWLNRRRAQLETESHLWGVYPRQDSMNELHLTLATRTLVAPPLAEDNFIIAGRVSAPPNGQHIFVEICRNRLSRNQANRNSEPTSFHLTIKGNLLMAHVGQIWRLQCVRSGLNIQMYQADHLQTSDMHSPDFIEFHPTIL